MSYGHCKLLVFSSCVKQGDAMATAILYLYNVPSVIIQVLRFQFYPCDFHHLVQFLTLVMMQFDRLMWNVHIILLFDWMSLLWILTFNTIILTIGQNFWKKGTCMNNWIFEHADMFHFSKVIKVWTVRQYAHSLLQHL